MEKKRQTRLYINILLEPKIKIKFIRKLKEKGYNNRGEFFREIVREVANSG